MNLEQSRPTGVWPLATYNTNIMTSQTTTPMLYRRFGRTELQMPILTCGGMRYQNKWQDQPLDEIPRDNQVNLEATVRRAIELGINHIETARGYGSSERQLGCVLPTFPRDKIMVQTKLTPEDDPDKFLAYFDESLERMRLDYVDLLAIHGINNQQTFDWSIRKGGCLAAARKLQQQGRVRHVGFSTHGPTDIILKAVCHEEDGGFDYMNLHWYYIFQKNWPAIEEAARRDMGVFIISPTEKGGKLFEPPAKLVELCKPLHPIVFNDLFCLSHDMVHTISIGAAHPGDFDLHLEAISLLPQADELLDPIVTRLKAAMKEAVGVEDPEAMGKTLPWWEDAPGQLNIPVMLWLRNLAVGWNMVEYGKMRFNLLGNGNHWFPGEKAEKLSDVSDEEILAAVANSPYARQIPGMLRQSLDLLAGEEVKRISQ